MSTSSSATFKEQVILQVHRIWIQARSSLIGRRLHVVLAETP